MTDSEAQFGTADCTCIPFTNRSGTPRYCAPGDTVDDITGWERRSDCPHHAPARTTPGNPAASSDTADGPLRERVAAAIEAADEHSCQMQDGPDYRALADAALAVVQPELDRLATALAAALNTFPDNLDPNGPAQRSRYVPAELLNRWRSISAGQQQEQP